MKFFPREKKNPLTITFKLKHMEQIEINFIESNSITIPIQLNQQNKKSNQIQDTK